MSGNSHTDKNGDVADVSVSPVEIIAVDEMEETKLAATRQKLIKAGLLAVLAVIVIYVVLDYTVSIYIYVGIICSFPKRSAFCCCGCCCCCCTHSSVVDSSSWPVGYVCVRLGHRLVTAYHGTW